MLAEEQNGRIIFKDKYLPGLKESTVLGEVKLNYRRIIRCAIMLMLAFVLIQLMISWNMRNCSFKDEYHWGFPF